MPSLLAARPNYHAVKPRPHGPARRRRRRIGQVSDAELDEIVKSGYSGAAGGGGAGATAGLIGDYGATPARTPMRTPRTPAAQNVIMEEARNAVLRNQAQTPLKGGENAELASGTGFAGETPSHTPVATPNVLANMTPGRHTPARGTPARGATPSGGTPMRDALGLNRDDAMSVVSSVGNKQRQRQLQSELRRGLSSLPAPQYSYEVVVPEAQTGEEDDEDIMELDASELDERAAKALRSAPPQYKRTHSHPHLTIPTQPTAAECSSPAATRRISDLATTAMLRRRARQAAEMKRRSSALQMALPRPTEVNKEPLQTAEDAGDETQLMIRKAIRAEALRMLRHDAAKYPVERPDRKGKKKKKKKARARHCRTRAAAAPPVPTLLPCGSCARP